MAEQYYNKQNILNLPKVETINPSDYLIVQDANSDTTTSLLQFQNFIIGLDNVTFGPMITDISDSVDNLNIKVDNLSAEIGETINSITTSGGKWEERMGNIELSTAAISGIIGSNETYTFSDADGKTIADEMSAIDNRLGEIEFLTNEQNIAGALMKIKDFCNAILSARSVAGKPGNMGTYLYNYLSGFNTYIEFNTSDSTPQENNNQNP